MVFSTLLLKVNPLKHHLQKGHIHMHMECPYNYNVDYSMMHSSMRMASDNIPIQHYKISTPGTVDLCHQSQLGKCQTTTHHWLLCWNCASCCWPRVALFYQSSSPGSNNWQTHSSFWGRTSPSSSGKDEGWGWAPGENLSAWSSIQTSNNNSLIQLVRLEPLKLS